MGENEMKCGYILRLLLDGFVQDWPVLSKGMIQPWDSVDAAPCPQYIMPTARLISELYEILATPDECKANEDLDESLLLSGVERLTRALLNHDKDEIIATVEALRKPIYFYGFEDLRNK